MDEQLRDEIGKVLYEQTADFSDAHTPQWDVLLNKEEWIVRAEKVVSAFLAHVRDNYGKGDKA